MLLRIIILKESKLRMVNGSDSGSSSGRANGTSAFEKEICK